MTTDQVLQQGVAAHKEGKLQDAERFYRAILQLQPNHPDANHNLGVLAVSVGKPLEAIPLFELALKANPSIEQFWLSYLDALIKLERVAEFESVLADAKEVGVAPEKLKLLSDQVQRVSPVAYKKAGKGLKVSEQRKRLVEKKKGRKSVKKALAGGATPSQRQINKLMDYYQAEQLDDAEALARSLTENFPEDAFAWKVLGAILKQKGWVVESLAVKQKSVELSPNEAEARNNLGNTLHELGRLEEAEASFREAIRLKPDDAEAHYNLGNALKDLDRLHEAVASYKQALGLQPAYAEAYYALGNILRELGRLHEAVDSYKQAMVFKPEYAEAANSLGVALQELGRLDEAQVSLRQAIALKPDLAEAHSNLGMTLQEVGRLADAETSLRQAIALRPDFAEAHRNLAATKEFTVQDEQFRQLEALYSNSTISGHDRCLICFALAKACEDLREFSRAFQLYAEGNALRKKQLAYDKAQDANLFRALKASLPRITLHALQPEVVSTEDTPIFVLGMPRSGTTLVEQIISSHSQVTGAGELPFASQFGSRLAFGQTSVDQEALRAFRNEYLAGLQRRSEGNAIVTDKMPHNFLMLGLIAAALPEAKIIHVKRDPAAVCWANYTQYFVKDSLGYCYSLEDIVHYHGLYEDLMTFWHQALPGRIYDLDYERLTKDQEEETRKLIDHLGLNWDDACLSPQDNKRVVGTASNLQVRQRVYQGSSERWKRYRPYLNGAFDHFSADN